MLVSKLNGNGIIVVCLQIGLVIKSVGNRMIALPVKVSGTGEQHISGEVTVIY